MGRRLGAGRFDRAVLRCDSTITSAAAPDATRERASGCARGAGRFLLSGLPENITSSPQSVRAAAPVRTTSMLDLQGHRGARALWPENTLAGFARAIDLGVSALELDCAVTRDGVVVVTHDPELNPDLTRDRDGVYLGAAGAPICSLSYAQLQEYDVGRLKPGTPYAARFPAQQPIDGERIPRLGDVLALVRERGRGRVRIALEVKTFPEQPELSLAP